MIKNIFNIGNILTIANLTCGITALAMVVNRDLWLACWFLVLGAVFDFFDGKLAKRLKQSSDVGIELDSLADMVTFGVVPPILVVTFHTGSNGVFPLWLMLPVLAFAYSSIWRLAKYNVQRDKSYFLGMPTTMNGIFLPAIYVFGVADFMWLYLIVAAVLMIIPVQLPNWGS